MTSPALRSAWTALNPSWVTGPIFEKELRVSARRRRNYVLRCGYLIVLTIFVVLVWASEMRSIIRNPTAPNIYRMARVGKTVILTITWFQFCATQLVAVILLSNSISDEIYHRTLGVLMTTPIRSFQVVLGKLLSKLWQVLILLGISLPLLAIVRVFGGVPWDFIAAGLCLTLTAVIFAGSVSLLFSIHTRRAYAVILKTLIVGGVVYALIPWCVTMLSMRRTPNWAIFSWLVHGNPFLMLGVLTQEMMTARGFPAGVTFRWPLQCAVMLGSSAAVLMLSMVLVRRAGLRQAVGGGQAEGAMVRLWGRLTRRRARPADGRIRRVVGWPIVWKEFRIPLLGKRKYMGVAGALGAVLVLAITYAICASENDLGDNETHIVYACILMGLAILVTGVIAATSITAEKESRSWPILLCTPLSEWEIVFGKGLGVLRKCLPLWLLPLGHVILFAFIGFIHPVALGHLLMISVGMIVFLTGLGIYFSTRYRRTTTAVVMSLGTMVGLWLVVPLLLALVSGISRGGNFLKWHLASNPMVQVIVATEATSGESRADTRVWHLDYDWPDSNSDSLATTSLRLTGYLFLYLFLGAFFAGLARHRMRQSVF